MRKKSLSYVIIISIVSAFGVSFLLYLYEYNLGGFWGYNPEHESNWEHVTTAQGIIDKRNEVKEKSQSDILLDNEKTFVESWPCFQGEAAMRGVYSGLLSDKLQRIWRVNLSGKISSSPIIVRSRVYVIVNFSGDTGDWSELYEVSLADGRITRHLRLDDKVDSTPCCSSGFIAAAGLDGNVVGILIEKDSGKPREGILEVSWRFRARDKITAHLMPYHGRVVFGSYDTSVYCLNIKTGKQLWNAVYADAIDPASAVSKDKIFTLGCGGVLQQNSFGDGSLVAKSIEKTVNGDTEPIAAPPTFSNGRLFFGTMQGKVVAYDVSANKKIWDTSARYKGDIRTGMAISNKHLVVTGIDGLVLCLASDTGKELWRYRCRDEVAASPVIASDGVYVGADDGFIRKFDISSGKVLWSYEIGTPIRSTCAVASGRMVVASHDGFLYCFGGK